MFGFLTSTSATRLFNLVAGGHFFQDFTGGPAQVLNMLAFLPCVLPDVAEANCGVEPVVDP